MATVKELLISVKAQFDKSSFNQSVNNIKQQLKDIKQPNIAPNVDTSKVNKAVGEVNAKLKGIKPPKIETPNVKNANLSGFNNSLKSGLINATNGIKNAVSNIQTQLNKIKAPIIKPKIDMSGMKQAYKSGLSEMQTIGLGLGLVGITKEAIEFENHMSGIAKQVAGARDASGNLTDVYKDMESVVRRLAKASPMSANEIADIVTAGARMNVATEDLELFTKTAIKMGTAFEAPAGEIADQMGKIANVFKIPITNIDGLAGAINYLDDNAISKGADIINVLQRVGGSASSIGLSATNVAALGSTFLSMGKAPEVASTAINSMITTLSTLDINNKGTIETFKTLGLNVAKFKTEFAKDAQGGITTVLTALGKLNNAQRIQASTDLFGRNFGDDIITVAGNMQEYNRQLELANSEKAKASLDAEYQNRLKTTSAQLEIFTNNLKDIVITIGQAVLPSLIAMTNAVMPIITAIGEFAKNNEWLVQTFIALIGIAVGFKVGAIALTAIVAGLGTAVSVLTLGFNLLKIAMVSNPIGAVIVGLTALAGVIYAVYKNWDSFVSFFSSTWDKIKSGFESVKSFLGMGDTTVDVNQTKNFIAKIPQNTQVNPMTQLPQQAQQQVLNTNSSKSTTVNDNKVINVNVASNGSATQAKDIGNILQQQNKNNFAYAGGGIR